MLYSFQMGAGPPCRIKKKFKRKIETVRDIGGGVRKC